MADARLRQAVPEHPEPDVLGPNGIGLSVWGDLPGPGHRSIDYCI